MNARVLAILLLALAAASCATGPTPTSTPTPLPTVAPPSASPNPLGTGHYDDGMLTFDFPADWSSKRAWYPSTVSELKTYLSTEELRPPCIQSGDAILCRSPIEELSPGGLLISWWRWGLDRGAPGPDPTTGQLIHVGGRSARLHDAAAEGHCLNIESDVALHLEIPDPTLDGSWTVMDACLRAPVEDSRAKIDELLASVEWSAPQPNTTATVLFGYALQIFDDTGLITDAQPVSGPNDPAASPAARVIDGQIQVTWVGDDCHREPTLGLAANSNRVLLLLEPGAGPISGYDCLGPSVPLGVVLALGEPIAQDNVYLEVW